MYSVDRRHRPLLIQTAADAPPRWAVVVVKICAIGILLLPLSTMLWFLLYSPRGSVDYRPLAFLASVGLGFGMWVTGTFIVSTYPPVRPTEKR